MRRILLSGLALVLFSAPVASQQVRVNGGGALAEYREQSAALRFHGSGFFAALDAEVRRFGLSGRITHVSFDAASSGDDTEPFAVDQSDILLTVRVTSRVRAEAGAMRRTVAPARAAQGVSSLRLGARIEQPLAPGAQLSAGASLLAGSQFSGGGSAPFGIEVRLGASYGPGSGRLRVTGEYEMQRLDRQTAVAGSRVDVPIQSSVARIGLLLTFSRRS